MPLSAGTNLGPYEILASIGAGGMGELYLACDTKRKRDVAIKVLPAALARDPDRLARFEREARLMASLDHPNIGVIYGLEESNNMRALVLALIEGPTLADRIATGPVPLEEAIHFARQMAEALEYAHERGVIHRDLKPANVKITPEGTVKVLDFGLAKALTGETDALSGSPANSPAMSPTLTIRATQAGMVLGTAAYMAPEQARGKAVDRRADIWAFGVVLYEMLTGRTAFAGDTVTDIIAAVVTREPDWTALPGSTTPSFRRLLAVCPEKDPKRRLRDIGDARLEIERIQTGAADATGPAPSAPVVKASSAITRIVLAAVVVATVAATWWLGQRAHPAQAAWSEFTQLTDASGVETGPSISPDGTTFAYASNARGSWDVYVQ